MEHSRSKKSRHSSSDHILLCDIAYDFVKHDDDGTVDKESFLYSLTSVGILEDDPRISFLMKQLEHCPKHIPRDMFVAAIENDIEVIEQSFSKGHLVPDFEKFYRQIKSIYRKVLSNKTGAVSTNTPQLSRQNPASFGVSVCTVDGQRFHLGDSKKEFLLHTCTKPISYCLAHEEHGSKVHKHVGRESSGDRHNTLALNREGLPHNPLLNSGGIMICSLIQPHMEPAEKFDYIQKTWSDLAGDKPFGFSNSAYLAEKSTKDRNYAIAHFLREQKTFPTTHKIDIDRILDFFFQCFALTGNTDKLSIVAGSLANGGICPLTGKKIFSPEVVKNCLSVMYTCGMSDYSGEFAFTTGLPACSGEAGAIIVVIPGVMGLCTYSPLLDIYGNSTRGVDFFMRLTQKFNFHMFDILDDQKKDPCFSFSMKKAMSAENVIRLSSLGDLSALKTLRNSVDELTVEDYDHRTPLHLAASNGHLQVVIYLVERVGVKNVNPVDRRFNTPFDDALREKHEEVAAFLHNVGGKHGQDVVRETQVSLNESIDELEEGSMENVVINQLVESEDTPEVVEMIKHELETVFE